MLISKLKHLCDIAILFKKGILIAGIKFWKVGSRKIFAIAVSEFLGAWSVRTSGTLGRMEGETVPFAGLIGAILILQRFWAWTIF